MSLEKQSVPETNGDVPSRSTVVNLLGLAAQAGDAHLAGDQEALATLIKKLKAINASHAQRPKRQRRSFGRYVE